MAGGFIRTGIAQRGKNKAKKKVDSRKIFEVTSRSCVSGMNDIPTVQQTPDGAATRIIKPERHASRCGK
ncbi:MAG: hypothetical protein PHD65_06795 [Gallionella sp.]|nr:hypothetical protein [Gallionella sp.]